jgi:hypothetical protein
VRARHRRAKVQTADTVHVERGTALCQVDTRSLVAAARAHMQRAEWSAAYEKLRDALRQSPEDVEVLEALGAVASELAQAEFKRLFAMAPDSARVHQLMAEALETQDRRTEAETEYQAALSAKPDLLDALLGLAKLKRVRLDCDGAIALYAKAEAIHATFDAPGGSCHARSAGGDCVGRPGFGAPESQSHGRRDREAASGDRAGTWDVRCVLHAGPRLPHRGRHHSREGGLRQGGTTPIRRFAASPLTSSHPRTVPVFPWRRMSCGPLLRAGAEQARREVVQVPAYAHLE